jgi:hypothetical protein
LLQQSPAQDFMVVYNERLKPHLADMPRTVAEGMNQLCRVKHYAFMVPKEETTEYLPQLSCQVVYLPEGLLEMKYAFVFNVHSPYIGLFRYTCVPKVTKSGRGKINITLEYSDMTVQLLSSQLL